MGTASDTIAAVATASGRAGIGIVRLSGPAATAIATRLAGPLPPPGQARVVTFRDPHGEPIDQGLLLRFAAPRSFTGEDVVEFQAHGGPVVLSGLVEAALAFGARRAGPGEFSQRAFLNGRLDLAQAEAVADLIAAGSAAQARAALRSLTGEFSTLVQSLAGRLLAVRVEVEAAIDFAEEDIEPANGERTAAVLAALADEVNALVASAERGRRLTDGTVVVLAGRPNAGKSSLLNRLSGHDAAIVSDEPGTTRDVLREAVSLGGCTLELIDTAGLRADPGAIEAEGIRRAEREMRRADHILFLVDAADPAAVAAAANDVAALPVGIPASVVYTKCDRVPAPVGAVGLSTVSGEGVDRLVALLTDLAGSGDGGAGTFSARARHVAALGRAAGHLEAARQVTAAGRASELLAEELRLAGAALGEVTGEVSSDDLLGAIFSTFCIGK